jgi:hypothetical protein
MDRAVEALKALKGIMGIGKNPLLGGVGVG